MRPILIPVTAALLLAGCAGTPLVGKGVNIESLTINVKVGGGESDCGPIPGPGIADIIDKLTEAQAAPLVAFLVALRGHLEANGC